MKRIPVFLAMPVNGSVMKVLLTLYFPKLILLLAISTLLSACATVSKSPSPTSQIIKKSVSISEKDSLAYVQAVADLEKGNAKVAAISLGKIAEKNPGYLDVWVNLAIANYTVKNIADAQRAIEHADKLQPASADINNIKGLICVESGQYKNAEKNYLNALKLDAKNPNIHYNMALLYDLYYQNIAKAIPYYESYLLLAGQKDEETEAWVQELKQTLKRE